MSGAGVVIGLTGGIGVGKTSVAALLANNGAQVIDVDGVGRAVLEPAGGAYEGVISTFGPQICGADGAIDRAALAAAVFGETNRLAELEAISHPAINAHLILELERTTSDVVVLDMAVLVESKLGLTAQGAMYQRVIVVEAPLELRIPRLEKRGLSADDARARMAAQATDHDRRQVADVIVTNDGTQAQLGERVAALAPTIAAWSQQQRPPKDNA